MNDKKKLQWTIEMSITWIEFFREFCGLSDDDFLKYMDDNNIWNYLCDYEFLHGSIHWDIDRWINFLGISFSIEEKYAMLMRYKKKNPNVITFDR